MTRASPASYVSQWVTKIYKSLRNLSVLEWLRLVWFILILWIERERYLLVPSCGWEDRRLPAHSKPTHVLLVTDARVRYAPLYGISLLGDIHNWFYELSLRKTWQVALSFKPDAVVFLGDMLASGRKIRSLEDFDAYHTSFAKIFSTTRSLSTYFVPGNEDIGLNLRTSDSHRARENYIDFFGPPNHYVSLENHTLVFMDAPGLVEEDYQRAEDHGISYQNWRPIEGGTVEFIKTLQNHDDDIVEPRILFSHIPLARGEVAYCGPLRVKGSIHRGAGPGYQNMLGKETTEFLLTTVKPAIVFSGDDRDYCEIRHSVSIDGTETFIPEVTIRSFSPVDGIPNVGFHLLSLVPPATAHDAPPTPTFAHSACFLPVPLRAYTSVYLPAAVLTFLALLVHRYWWARRHHQRRRPLSASLLPPAKSTASHWVQEAGRLASAIPDLEYGAPEADKIAPVRTHRPQISLDRSRDTPSWPNNNSTVPRAWTFNFAGRRRRLVLRRPRLYFLDSILSSVSRKFERLPWAHTPVFVIVADFLKIIWPGLLLWTVLTWWTMR